MAFMILHYWFHESHMTIKTIIFYYMISNSNDLSHKIMLNNNEITRSDEEELLTHF